MGSRDTAERFLESAEYTFNQLATTPNISKILQLPDILKVRQWRIKKFKEYLVFYIFREQKVEILRVLHGAIDLENFVDLLD
jgi:toxin ParE1/3/4